MNNFNEFCGWLFKEMKKLQISEQNKKLLWKLALAQFIFLLGIYIFILALNSLSHAMVRIHLPIHETTIRNSFPLVNSNMTAPEELKRYALTSIENERAITSLGNRLRETDTGYSYHIITPGLFPQRGKTFVKYVDFEEMSHHTIIHERGRIQRLPERNLHLNELARRGRGS